MSTKKHKLLTAGIAATMLISSTAVFAADADVYRLADKSKLYTNYQARTDVTARKHVRTATSELGYELNGRIYKLTDANVAFRRDENNFERILEREYAGVSIEYPYASIGGVPVKITNNSATVNYRLGYAMPEVEVEFENPVTVESIIVNGLIISSESGEQGLKEQLAKNYNIKLDKSNDNRRFIVSSDVKLTQSHIDKYGDSIKVKLKDGTIFTINLVERR